METIVERCAGLDVHQAKVVACLLTGLPGKRVKKEIRSFGTMTCELGAMRDWLLAAGCTVVAMESTGVFWMPVYAQLEAHFDVIVGNATHIKNVPGRKTDVNDAQWIADLCRHGLIRKSFVPPPPIRALRDFTRYRRKLVQECAAEENRLMRLLETANVKLSTVLSEVLGVSGRDMLRAILDGQSSPEEMAQLARGRLRKKIDILPMALDGRVDEHHRFILRMQLRRIEGIERDILELETEINAKLKPYEEQLARLITIPGVDRTAAAVIIAELGVDMTVFPTAGHASAWAGVSPGNNESAGRTRGTTHRKGNVHLMSMLVQSALCAARQKDSYLRHKYYRLRAKRGPKRAAVAIAHKILVAAYNMLAHGTTYKDLGADYLDRLTPKEVAAKLIRRLEQLGLHVTVTPTEQPTSRTS